MLDTREIYDLALAAETAGRPRVARGLAHRLLQEDFRDLQAWELLYRQSGDGVDFETFRDGYIRRYFIHQAISTATPFPDCYEVRLLPGFRPRGRVFAVFGEGRLLAVVERRKSPQVLYLFFADLERSLPIYRVERAFQGNYERDGAEVEVLRFWKEPGTLLGTRRSFDPGSDLLIPAPNARLAPFCIGRRWPTRQSVFVASLEPGWSQAAMKITRPGGQRTLDPGALAMVERVDQCGVYAREVEELLMMESVLQVIRFCEEFSPQPHPGCVPGLLQLLQSPAMARQQVGGQRG